MTKSDRQNNRSILLSQCVLLNFCRGWIFVQMIIPIMLPLWRCVSLCPFILLFVGLFVYMSLPLPIFKDLSCPLKNLVKADWVHICSHCPSSTFPELSPSVFSCMYVIFCRNFLQLIDLSFSPKFDPLLCSLGFYFPVGNLHLPIRIILTA